MSPELQTYLELERLMLLWDERDERLADRLRDAMDPFWYELSAQERDLLNLRSIGVVKSFEEIRVPLADVLGTARGPRPPDPLPTGPVPGWRSVV